MTKKILPIYGVPPEVKAQYDRLTGELVTVLNTMETVTEFRETMKACMRDNKRYMDILQYLRTRLRRLAYGNGREQGTANCL